MKWSGIIKLGMKWKNSKDFITVKLGLINVAQVLLRSTFANCFGFGISQALNRLGMKWSDIKKLGMKWKNRNDFITVKLGLISDKCSSMSLDHL